MAVTASGASKSKSKSSAGGVAGGETSAQAKAHQKLAVGIFAGGMSILLFSFGSCLIFLGVNIILNAVAWYFVTLGGILLSLFQVMTIATPPRPGKKESVSTKVNSQGAKSGKSKADSNISMKDTAVSEKSMRSTREDV